MPPMFGDAAALSADTLVVGASNEDSNSTGVNPSTTSTGGANHSISGGTGAVYVRRIAP